MDSTSSVWRKFSSTQQAIATVIVVFLAGLGFGLQFFQFTSIPAKLTALNIEHEAAEAEVENLRYLITSNTLQIAQLVCLQVAEIEETDPRLCPLSR